MSSVRGVESWQDAYIFCLQPNFQDDLWLFMIFAAIQVSLAGLKLTSFFINRWARGSKVGSGDDDEDNVGDDGASGGISIMGVLTLIAGALILAAYCDDEPDQKTFNIFKAGVYLNTFLFAVALIFICGLVIAFVIDILTRRRGRSITFRMFLGGTIVLTIAASFFGATGIMGLKYLQSDCYDEVDLYFKDPDRYLLQPKEFAEEAFGSYSTKPTQEKLYEIYEDKIIGEPYIFSKEKDSENDLYVYSVVYKSVKTRAQLLRMKVQTAEFTYTSSGQLQGLSKKDTEASCFETVGGFGEINGMLTCGIRYSQFQQAYGRYEESKKKIVGREQCAHDDRQIECDTGSPSFPLCCKQFSDEYTWTKGCACINSPTDASCGFDKDIVDCTYRPATLDISITAQRDYFCGSSTTGWCEKENSSYSWDKKCKSETTLDDKYVCCQTANVWSDALKERKWEKWGQEIIVDMVPETCKQFDECHTASDFYNGCCKTSTLKDTTLHSDCQYCEAGPADASVESDHADNCGYSKCLVGNLQDKIKCCSDVETRYGFTFPANSVCRIAIDYNPCDDLSQNSLACNTINDDCKRTDDCFPNCCTGKNFDFATDDTITKSTKSHCFQEASEKIGQINQNEDLLGLYIYHRTGAEGSLRESCKKINGIIDPKCCSNTLQYTAEDPCYCHRQGHDISACKKIHHSECLPGHDAYPQCCFDIGDFFGDNHSCKCRLKDAKENFTGENPDCNKVDTSKPSFEFIDNCPNPCRYGKALIDGDSLICELPIFEL